MVVLCFVDDTDDYEFYKKGNYSAMAKRLLMGFSK